MNRLQNMLNFAAKVIYGRPKFDKVSDLLSDLCWMTCEQLYTCHALSILYNVSTYKIIRSGEPEALVCALTLHCVSDT